MSTTTGCKGNGTGTTVFTIEPNDDKFPGTGIRLADEGSRSNHVSDGMEITKEPSMVKNNINHSIVGYGNEGNIQGSYNRNINSSKNNDDKDNSTQEPKGSKSNDGRIPVRNVGNTIQGNQNRNNIQGDYNSNINYNNNNDNNTQKGKGSERDNLKGNVHGVKADSCDKKNAN